MALDAGRQVGAVVVLLDVLPGRERRLDALDDRTVGFRQLLDQRRIGPELVLDLGHHDFRVREDLRVGLLHPQAGDVIAMEMRDHHGGDGRGIEAGRLHVVGELADGGAPLPPKPVSNRITLPPVLIAVTVKGLSNLSGPMPPRSRPS